MILDFVRSNLREKAVKSATITQLDCTHPATKQLHVPSWAFVSAATRFNAVVCSRRAAKSHSAVRRAARILLAKPGARVCYVTLIRRNAKKYFASPLHSLAVKKGVECELNSSDLMLEFGNGSFAQALGCTDLSEVETVLGDQWDLAIIDEAQSFRDVVIKELVERAIMPSLVDRKGGLDLLGTPPPAGAVGYLYDQFVGGRFKPFQWTLFDNPWIDPAEIAELIQVQGITPEHALYKREYLGEFVVDPSSLVFEYAPQRNDWVADMKPDPADPMWCFSMGVDLGFSDRDAIVVLGWRRDDPMHRLHEAWAWQKNHLDFDTLATVFHDAVNRWHPMRIVGDTGGHGAVKIIKSLEARLASTAIEQKPASVEDSIALVNGDMRTGRILLDPQGPIVADMKLTTWEAARNTKSKRVISDAYHSDILAAFRYAHSCAMHFTASVGNAQPIETEDQRLARLIYQRAQAEQDPYGIGN